MPGEIQLDSFARLDEQNGRVMSATLYGDDGYAEIHVEMSDSDKDVRVVDGDHAIKIRINRDGTIRDVLIDDVIAWSREGGG